jgi:hypothetical protein
MAAEHEAADEAVEPEDVETASAEEEIAAAEAAPGRRPGRRRREDSMDEPTKIRWWQRSILLLFTVPWIAVLATAMWLYPYDENGAPLKQGTHQQLGLPPCNFQTWTGVPCPSCGMTTSFSLLVHGDVWNSLKANFAGTALVTFGILFVPWAFASAFLKRFLFIRSLEMVVFRLAVVFLVMLFGRWGIVLLIHLLGSS